MRRRCYTCRHYHADRTSNPPATGGECRRKAPRLAQDGAVYAANDCAPYGYWPIVSADYWCGEWQAQRNE